MALRNAFVLGCNGVLGRALVSHFRSRPGWHVIGADILSAPREDDLEVISMNANSSGWADEVSSVADQLPELDLVVRSLSRRRAPG